MTEILKHSEVAKRVNLTFNNEKCIIGVKSIKMLGYLIAHGSIKPDPDRLASLLEMPIPHDIKSHQRAVGLLAYYAKWIPRFSEKVKPLAECTTFPMDEKAVRTFRALLNDVKDSALTGYDPNLPLTVETDASDNAIAAVLTQDGKPVAFFSRTLNVS